MDSAQSYSTSRTTRTSGATPQVSMMLSREMKKTVQRKRVQMCTSSVDDDLPENEI